MDITPRATIKGRLRQLFLMSNERNAALKRDNYTCVKCNKKQSQKKGHVVKIHVHHKQGIKWDNIISLIQQQLLCPVDMLEVMCVDCHVSES